MGLIRTTDRIRDLLPGDYRLHHSLVALAIMAIVTSALWALGAPILPAAVGGASTGSAFYVSREYAQAELKGYWDHPGWVWPVVCCWGVVLVWVGLTDAGVAR